MARQNRTTGQVQEDTAETMQPAAGASAPVVVMSGEQMAREQIAREMAEQAKNPLDTAKRAGGEFIVNGKRVDANGEAVKGKASDDDAE